MTRRRSPCVLSGLLAAVLLGALAPASPAATVAFVVPAEVPVDPVSPGERTATLSVIDVDAQPNRLRLVRDASGVTVTDSAAALTPGSNCQAVSPFQVRCTTPDVDVVEVIGGGGADSIDTSGVRFGVREAVTVALYGGAGDDTLIGGPGAELFDGGPGRDTIRGGAGTDTVSFADQRAAVQVDLARGLTRSGPGSRDSVTGIEDATGGAGDDVLRGDGKSNLLVGGPGDDVVDGRGGNDILEGDMDSEDFMGEQLDDGRDRLLGGPGADLMRPSAVPGDRRDVLACGPGNDGVTMLDQFDRFSGCETNGLDDSSGRVAIPLGPARISAGAVLLPLSCSGSRSCFMLAEILDARSRVLGVFRARRFRPGGGPGRRVTVKLNARGRRTLRGRRPAFLIVRIATTVPGQSAGGTWSMPVRR